MKERCPVILPPDHKGQTEINPIFVSYMSQVSIGTHPEEMDLSDIQVRKIRDKFRDAGIDFPVGNEWFATGTQRRILHAYDTGNTTYARIEERLQITNGNARVQVSNLRRSMREQGMTVEINIQRPKPERLMTSENQAYSLEAISIPPFSSHSDPNLVGGF